MSNSESERLAQLRAVVANEGVTVPERTKAAEHYVELLVSAVLEPKDTDAEVIELLAVPPDKGESRFTDLLQTARELRNKSFGWAESGPTVRQAKERVHNRLRLRKLLSVIVTESELKMIRVEACQRVLTDHLHERGFHRANGFTAEMMFAAIQPSNAMKWSGLLKQVPVERPPITLADVW